MDKLSFRLVKRYKRMKKIVLRIMLNKWKSLVVVKVFLLLFISILPVTITSAVYIAGANKVAADGSFLQSWLCGYWSDARWQQEFTAMKNAGMHYLIIGPAVECDTGKITITYYPSTLPNTEMAGYLSGKDMIDMCLRNAEAAGIKVFIGISSNNLWWKAHGADTTWLYNQMKFDNKVCDELWTLYKNKYPSTFYGWYWVYEIDNGSFVTDEQQNELIHAMNIQLDHLSAVNEKLPFMWCPFMNGNIGTPDAYQSMWQNVFSKLNTTAGDIFAPQDGIGAGGLTLSELPAWYSALRTAVDTKPGLKFWSDVETFDHRDWTSATIDRIIKQMQIEQPYVDNYITFAYCHYQSPYNTDPGYQATYIDYLNTGTLESTPPSVPANFTAVLNSNADAVLNWDASTDNIGVCGYYINRNGILICKEQVPRFDGTVKSLTLATSLTDACLESNMDYTYEVQAFDFANNISSTIPITINTGKSVYLNNIISIGCSYTVSIPASTSYPDNGNKELTNGSYARLDVMGDPGWEGVYDASQSTRDIVIDLGSEKPVRQFIADYLYSSSSSIYLPKQVEVLVSKDNINFSNEGNIPLPNIPPYGASASSYKCVSTLSSPVDARYVKFSVTPGSPWTFDDEYEVRNNTTTSINEEKEIPREYSLQQNYPNPFNPSTVIKYQIAKGGHVMLKIYDVLGMEIETLVNEEKAAGNYSFNLNASSFPSGVYFYQIRSGSYIETKKMVLLK